MLEPSIADLTRQVAELKSGTVDLTVAVAVNGMLPGGAGERVPG